MDWHRDGADWPNHRASRFVGAGGLRWHVQVLGRGPVLLLVHGTGATTHSWRELAPLLARRYTIVAPDLPGHGYSAMAGASGMSLQGMADRLAALLRALDLAPEIAAGHSAGAAVLARMALDHRIRPRVLVGLNAALTPLAGMLRAMSPVARLLASLPGIPTFAAAHAGRGPAVHRLIASTGSTLDDTGTRLYARLLQDPAHVAGALAMMAHWQLDALWAELPSLPVPLKLVVGSADRTIPPVQARRVAAHVRGTQVVALPGLGHLAHEEHPRGVAALLLRWARQHGVLACERCADAA
jgi:magnesium chelatase accessory protein